MIYLIVGLDRNTYARWHQNVCADEIVAAERIAQARAEAQGIDLVIAAVIGANSAVLSDARDLAGSAGCVVRGGPGSSGRAEPA